MQHRTRTTIAAGFAALALLATGTPASATVSGTTEGCTPGYWKVPQHHDSWQETLPSNPLTGMYSGASAYSTISGLTQVEALAGGGGSGTDGAAQILARAAVAAWLNAAYDDADGHLLYPWRRYAVGEEDRPPLVATVNAAFASGSRDQMLALAGVLDRDNNLGCPLS